MMCVSRCIAKTVYGVWLFILALRSRCMVYGYCCVGPPHRSPHDSWSLTAGIGIRTWRCNGGLSVRGFVVISLFEFMMVLSIDADDDFDNFYCCNYVEAVFHLRVVQADRISDHNVVSCADIFVFLGRVEKHV